MEKLIIFLILSFIFGSIILALVEFFYTLGYLEKQYAARLEERKEKTQRLKEDE